MATFLQNNDVEIVNFNKGEYKVSNVVEFNLKNRRNFTIDFGGGSILLTQSFNYYYKGIFTFIFDKSKNAKITIKNGFFNGVGNPTNFSSTNVHPIGGICTVTQVKGNCGKTASGWICLEYCSKL